MKIFRTVFLLALLTHQCFAADAFTRWWTQFRVAVAASDAKAVSAGATFPQPWENGKIRDIPSLEEFTKNYARYMTPEIQKLIATRKPERLPTGTYSITWKARGNEYSIYFKPGAVSGTYVLDGLSEGPP